MEQADTASNGKLQQGGSVRSKKDKGVADGTASGGTTTTEKLSTENRKTIRKTNKVYISNIPYKCRQQELKELFSVIGEVESIELFLDEDIKPRGCGLVEFIDQESVTKCIARFNRYNINGREILVREDQGEERDKHGRTKAEAKKASAGGGGGGGGSNMAMFNTYGLNKAFLDKLGIEGPLSNRIFISNLDFTVDTKKLTQIFKLAGKITDIELGIDEEGNSRGFAIIEYEHPVEAVQAISMFDRQMLFERRMYVRLDKKPDRNENLKLLDGLGGIGRGLGPNGKPLKNIAAQLQQQQSLSMVPPVQTSLNYPHEANGPTSLLGPVPTGDLNATGGNMGNIEALSNLLTVAANLNNLGLINGAGNDMGGPVSAQAKQQLNNGTLNLMANRKISDPLSLNNANLMQLLGQQLDANGTTGGGSGSGSAGGGIDKRSETIIIKNLPINYSWKILRDKCSYIGEVKYTKVTDTGYGIVRFSTVSDAEKAVTLLDGFRFDGRTVSVTFL